MNTSPDRTGTGPSGHSGDGTAGPIDLTAMFSRVNDDIRRFAERHGREPGDIQLLAVSKTKPIEAIEAAIAAGQRAFGENYVDEGIEKTSHLAEHELDWHFIGTIQSRRCEAIATGFDWAHGVDRLKIARRLGERRPADRPPLNICLQLNVDGEASKSGVSLDDIDALADACADISGLRLRGLMAIPAPRDDLAGQRQAFATVRECLERLRERGHASMDTLSMGMSGDLEAAIAEGATLVRVGTALFGARARPG